jgi:predicted HTH transcriptional regulator
MSAPPPIQRELVALLDHPREDLNTELKDWLDLADKGARANLAKELLALANHGGGYVLFGFEDTTTGWVASGACAHKPEHYSQDKINNILKAHAEPVFECYTYHLQSGAGDDHVVIQVPGGHTVPIRARGGPRNSRLADHTYYIRRAGPRARQPATHASGMN